MTSNRESNDSPGPGIVQAGIAAEVPAGPPATGGMDSGRMLAELSMLAKSWADAPDEAAALATLGRRAGPLFGALSAVYARPQRDQSVLALFRVAIDAPIGSEGIDPMTRDVAVAGGLAGKVLRSGRLLCVGPHDGRLYPDFALLGGSPTRAVHVFPIRDYGSPIGVVAFAGDEATITGSASVLGHLVESMLGEVITRIRKVRQVAEIGAEAEARTRMLIDAVPVPLTIRDDAGKFILANEAAADQYGIAAERLVGRSVYDLGWEPAEIQRQLDEDRVVIGGQPLLNPDDHIPVADGRFTRVASTKIPFPFGPAARNAVLTVNQPVEAGTGAVRSTGRAIEALIDESPLALFALDAAGLIVSVSRFGSALLGYRSDELRGVAFGALHRHEDRVRLDERLHELHESQDEEVRGFEACMLRRDGSEVTVRAAAKPARTGGDVATLIVCEDVSDLRRATEALERQSTTDMLTGLPNRAALDQRLMERIAAADAEGGPLAVLFIDLDRFKGVNDTLGHSIGDELLRAVAERIRENIGAGDTVARIGGDEFVVVLDRIDAPEDALGVGRKLIRSLQAPFSIGGQHLGIGASIGVSTYPGDGLDPVELMKHADIAMYRAKELGRNNCQLYSHEMSARLRSRLSRENALRQAIERNELRLVFQPIVGLYSGRIEALEALVRWQTTSSGMLLPGDFIALAEESGLIGEITTWVLRNALPVVRELRDAGHPLRLAVNVSAREFMDSEALVDRVALALAAADFPACALELEITEGVFLRYGESARTVMHGLKELGVRLALDDFGTGFSSLNHLLDMPIDVVKLDRELTESVDTDPRRAEVLRAVLEIGKTLGIECVAEGISASNQLAKLVELGYRLGQGYHLAAPMRPEEVASLMRATGGVLSVAPAPVPVIAGGRARKTAAGLAVLLN